jgi:hypothetical protein
VAWRGLDAIHLHVPARQPFSFDRECDFPSHLRDVTGGTRLSSQMVSYVLLKRIAGQYRIPLSWRRCHWRGSVRSHLGFAWSCRWSQRTRRNDILRWSRYFRWWRISSPRRWACGWTGFSLSLVSEKADLETRFVSLHIRSIASFGKHGL